MMVSLNPGRGAADPGIQRPRAIALRHLGKRDHLDVRRIPRRPELFEPFATERAQRIHRGFQEFSRIEFALGLRGDLAKRRRHRQPTIGIDVHLAHAVPDTAHDLLDRNAEGLRHLAAEGVERVLQVLRHR